MEKYLIIEYKNNKYDVLGNVNLPETLELEKNYVLNIKDTNYLLTNILTIKIYSENNPIAIFLGIDYIYDKTLQNKPLTNHYSLNSGYQLIDKNYIKTKFLSELANNRINLKSYFRKDKISKILQESDDLKRGDIGS